MWILKLIPLGTISFSVYVIWVIIDRHRLNAQTAYLAASDSIYWDPFWSLDLRRDVSSISFPMLEHRKVAYIPCVFNKRQVILKTTYNHYIKTKNCVVILK